MKLRGKKILAMGIALSLVVSGTALSINAEAAKKTAKVKKIKLNKKKATIYAKAAGTYGSVTLKASISPKSARKTKIKWKSSNKKVATVSSKGIVKGKKAGKAKITATAGKKKAVCTVTVKKIKKKVSKVTVTPKSLRLVKGKSANLKVKVAPGNATLKKVIYQSGNKKVVKVSAAGKVTAVGAGSTKITVTAADGSKKKATVSVKVTNPVTPTKKPTATPSPAPTNKPTEEPTQAPTAEPTQVPTEEPTQEPTQAPTAEPTQAPTEAPTQEPYSTLVEGVSDGINTTFALEPETSYMVKATLGDGVHSFTTNEATETVVKKAMDYLLAENDIGGGFTKYVNCASNYASEIGEGTDVVIHKYAGSQVASVEVKSSDVRLNGTYTLTVTASDDIYHVSFVKGEEYSFQAKISQVDTDKYLVKEMEVKKAGEIVKQGLLNGKTVTVEVKRGNGVTSMEASYGEKKISVAYDGSTIKEIILPNQYIEQYRLQILK